MPKPPVVEFVFITRNCLVCIYALQISYECALKARETFITFYSSILDTLVTDAPTIGSSDNKYKKVGDLL